MLEDSELAQLFTKKGLIDEETLQKAKDTASNAKRSLYDVLLQDQVVDEERAIVAVSKQLNLPCVSLKEFEANQRILNLVKKDLAESFSIMPLGLTEEEGERKLYVAMANPLDLNAIEEVSKASGFPVVQLLAGPNDIAEAISRSYEIEGSDNAAAEGLGDMLGELDDLFDKSDFMSEGDGKSDSGLGFSLDFGDLGLSVSRDKSTPKKDVHNRQTLPAGTEIPEDLGEKKGESEFQKVPTANRKMSDNELKQLEDGSFSLGDDWDLGDLGGDGDSTPMPSPRPQRTENSTIRYVADPSLRGRSERDEFPWNVSSSDLIRATVMLLIKKGVFSEAQIREEVKRIRRERRR